MTLVRITTYIGGPLYAARIPGPEGSIAWRPKKDTVATLFRKDEARAIAKRLRRKPLRMKIKLEVA